MEDLGLGWSVLAFFGLVSATIAFSYFFILRPARRTLQTVQRYRADLARDLLRTLPVSDMRFVEGSVRILIDELQKREAELRALYGQASERAERAERHAAQVLGSVPSGVVAADRAGRVTAANAAAAQILGRPDEALVGIRVRELFDRTPRIAELVEQAAAGGAQVSGEDASLLGEDGRLRTLSVSTSALPGADGAPEGCVCLLTDLTRIRELEERVALQEKLASLGELSAGLAHELRNPLASIVGYAKLMRKDSTASEDTAANASTIVAEAESLERLVRDFLDFARPISVEPASSDLRGVAEAAAASVRPQAERARVNVAIVPGRPLPCRADAERVQQLLENLIRNAVEASPPGSRVEVTIGVEGEDASVQVRDAGSGVEPQHMARLFTPFFSTKKDGVGMGLALSQRIAAAHGGLISAANAPGGGAVFTLHLPLATGTP